MKRTLDDKIYQDKTIKCPNCKTFTIGHQKLDGQILILESGLICFSFLAWQCPKCLKNSSWKSPILPDEVETVDTLFPDVNDLQVKSKGISKMFGKYRARVSVGRGRTKYLGLFDSETEARQAILKEKTAKS